MLKWTKDEKVKHSAPAVQVPRECCNRRHEYKYCIFFALLQYTGRASRRFTLLYVHARDLFYVPLAHILYLTDSFGFSKRT
jgi:hypothetical protein